MSTRLPIPPPDSPFHVQYDDQGRIYLTWRKPLYWLAELGNFVLWVVAGIMVL